VRGERRAKENVRGLLGAILSGVALGAVAGVWATYWQDPTSSESFNLRLAVQQAGIGALIGGVMAPVLFVTRRFRTRGTIEHYLSWMVACVVGCIAFLSPEVPRDGLLSVLLFSLILGVCGGIAMGYIARELGRR
jgi:hypothetical protein